MTPNVIPMDNDLLPGESLPINLGPKELFFLATILFFGFSGFSVCYDNITTAPGPDNIAKLTQYPTEYNTAISATHVADRGYSISE